MYVGDFLSRTCQEFGDGTIWCGCIAACQTRRRVDVTNGTSLGRNLRFHNKFRITGDFGPSPASGAIATEGAEKCQALVASGDKAWHLLIASVLCKMVYAYASAIRRCDRRAQQGRG